jgi:hypothetical protein
MGMLMIMAVGMLVSLSVLMAVRMGMGSSICVGVLMVMGCFMMVMSMGNWISIFVCNQMHMCNLLSECRKPAISSLPAC